MKLYYCDCGAPLFFSNTQCLACGSAVGYDHSGDCMVSLHPGAARQLCANGSLYGVCNWITYQNAPGLCASCGLNRTIPDLSRPDSIPLWSKMEKAKRRTLHWLLRRGLSIAPRTETERGLAFDFLMPHDGQPVVTGHDCGLVTMNLEEADDSVRERNRQQLKEPYRTLLGHFRHELAHYYWWLWFGDGGSHPEWLDTVREVFGDDRADYAAALQSYYTSGAPAGWSQRFISAYATMHPWEDWAETWAHFVHITDALETAAETKLERTGTRLNPVLDPELITLPGPFASEPSEGFLRTVADWMHLAPALNEISLSLGHGDLYPFTPAPAMLRKLHCIHQIVRAAGDPKI